MEFLVPKGVDSGLRVKGLYAIYFYLLVILIATSLLLMFAGAMLGIPLSTMILIGAVGFGISFFLPPYLNKRFGKRGHIHLQTSWLLPIGLINRKSCRQMLLTQSANRVAIKKQELKEGKRERSK